MTPRKVGGLEGCGWRRVRPDSGAHGGCLVTVGRIDCGGDGRSQGPGWRGLCWSRRAVMGLD